MIEHDLSILTTIPEEHLTKVHKCLDMIHSHTIVENIIKDENFIELDIFEGKLILQLVDDSVKYKFIPSEDFNNLVIDSIINKKDKLLVNISDRLKSQFINAYKNIL